MDLTEALNSIRTAAGGPGARINLAEFGNRLRKCGLDPGWAGGRKLSEVLGEMPGFVTVESGTAVFGGGAPTAQPSQGAHAGVTVRTDLFHALVTDRPDRAAYLHLPTFEIVEVPLVEGVPGSPVAELDIEYVRVPCLTTEEQRAFVRGWLAPHVAEDVIAYVLGGEGADWVQRGRSQLPPDLWDGLWEGRRALVVGRAIEFLHRHDVPEDRFVRRRTRESARSASVATRSNTEGAAAPDGDLEGRLRERVHRAIERMTLAELSELRIPARVLLDG